MAQVKVTGVPGTYITTNGVVIFPSEGVGYFGEKEAQELSELDGFAIVEEKEKRVSKGEDMLFTPAAARLGLVVDDEEEDEDGTTVQKTGKATGKKLNVNRVAPVNTEE